MRKKFIECDTESEAYDACPWATVVEQVEGGWMCFEGLDDYKIWKNQV